MSSLFLPANTLGKTSREALRCPPAALGCYAWFFEGLDGQVPTEKCLARDQGILLYAGIAGKKVFFKETLNFRITDHFRATAQRSTLRSTLGYLLEKRLGTVMRRVWPTGATWTYAEAEENLTEW